MLRSMSVMILAAILLASCAPALAAPEKLAEPAAEKLPPQAPDKAAGPAPDLAASATSSCPVTQPAIDEPPDDPNADPFGRGPYYINADRTLWASAPPEGYSWHAGGEKMVWIRPAGSDLQVSGQRLDGDAPPLYADIPCCYPTGFQIAGLIFPTEGCWQVEAQAGEHHLDFVVQVAPNDRPAPGGTCQKLEDAVQLSDAIIVGHVNTVQTTPGHAWLDVAVRSLLKKPLGWPNIGDRISLLQDLQEQPALESGKNYLLFMQYSPWQVVCAQGSLFEIESSGAVAPLGAQPLWKGGDMLEMNQELDLLLTGQ